MNKLKYVCTALDNGGVYDNEIIIHLATDTL